MLGALKFLANQPVLLVGGLDLKAIALGLLLQLDGLLGQHALLRDQGCGSRLELGLLHLLGVLGRQQVIALQGDELSRPGDGRGAELFGPEARLLSLEAVDLGREGGLHGLGVGARHGDQDLTGLDLLALLHVQGGDDPALLVLDALAMAFHRHLALGHGGLVEPGDGRPAEEHDEEACRDDPAGSDLPPAVVVLFRKRGGRNRIVGAAGNDGVTHDAARVAGFGWGVTLGEDSRARTSSRGP